MQLVLDLSTSGFINVGGVFEFWKFVDDPFAAFRVNVRWRI